jgi:uncharacterized OsmC-like protein
MADSYTATATRTGPEQFTVSNGTSTVVSDAGMRPSELLLASLTSCILWTVVDYAERNRIELPGEVSVTASGSMANRPRRVGEIRVELVLPDGLGEKHRDALLRAGQHCPVHATLTHAPELTVALR